MELYQLNTFVAVAGKGHLTRAAKSLHTSQSAVSAHIKALETELGVDLFQRTPKGMLLTPAGKTLYRQARKVLDSINDIKVQARAHDTRPSGIVKLGLNINPSFLKLNELLSFSRTSFPGIEYHLIQQMTWEAVEAVESGKLDCAFVYGDVDSSRFGSVRLKTMPVVVAAPVVLKNDIANAGWDKVGALPWITTPSICGFHDISQQIFKKHKINPPVIAVADEESTIQRMVVSGAGVALMVADEAGSLERDGQIVIWKREVGTLTLLFIHARKNEKEKKIQAMVTAVKKVWNLP